MPLLRTLVASAVFSDLKDLELPKWDEFDHFQPNQAPQLDYILHLLKPYRVAAPENDAMGLGQYSSGKLLRKLQIEQAKHEAKPTTSSTNGLVWNQMSVVYLGLC
ncbi:hypothetical protein LB505_005616 [Fusarium chuoi]|nr:hypothetical protein LB505_005616 [Fusarium chuoi]